MNHMPGSSGDNSGLRTLYRLHVGKLAVIGCLKLRAPTYLRLAAYNVPA